MHGHAQLVASYYTYAHESGKLLDTELLYTFINIASYVP